MCPTPVISRFDVVERYGPGHVPILDLIPEAANRKPLAGIVRAIPDARLEELSLRALAMTQMTLMTARAVLDEIWNEQTRRARAKR